MLELRGITKSYGSRRVLDDVLRRADDPRPARSGNRRRWPAVTLAAAADLGVPVEGSVVLEDAISGVKAGAAGGFGLVIGVDRGVGAEALTDAGAGLVVTDLEELL